MGLWNYGYDWISPAGIASGWSAGDVPEDMKAKGWTSVERKPIRESSSTDGI